MYLYMKISQMSVELIERVTTDSLDIELTIDNYTTGFYTTLSDFASSLDMDSIVYSDSVIKDLFVLTIKNYKQKHDDYSVAIDKRHVIDYLDSFITTLEMKEEYEVCSAFLKLKNKYKDLENEE